MGGNNQKTINDSSIYALNVEIHRTRMPKESPREGGDSHRYQLSYRWVGNMKNYQPEVILSRVR